MPVWPDETLTESFVEFTETLFEYSVELDHQCLSGFQQRCVKRALGLASIYHGYGKPWQHAETRRIQWTTISDCVPCLSKTDPILQGEHLSNNIDRS